MGEEQLASLEADIEAEYQRGGHTLGWRFLYSPVEAIAEARVAFVGLNPGGTKADANHGEFAVKEGSAYVTERWGSDPGESKLQLQVRGLFGHLGVAPEEVLAGNLVPFRSRDWDSLSHKKAALAFGERLWSKVFEIKRPSLVIAMGGLVTRSMSNILQIRSPQQIGVGWGNTKGTTGSFEGGRFVGLPHLSRFGIIGRQSSEPGLKLLFGKDWAE